MAVIEKRLEVTAIEPTGEDLLDGSELVTALCRAQKALPPRFLYDARGRDLYQRLITVPEYYMPRAANAVLTHHLDEVPQITGPVDIIELGADDIAVTRHLLDAYRKPGRAQLYVPVVADRDRTLVNGPLLLRQYPDLTIHGLSGEGGTAAGALPPRSADGRMVVCLDNALGMLTGDACGAFLKGVRRTLQSGDWFLAGVDLETEPEIIEAAYNDSEGLAAELNLNALHHINSHYGGQIDVGKFSHRARYDADNHQIEMSLRSEEQQVVRIPGLGFEFEMLKDSSILTELSRKFTMSLIDSEFSAAGFSYRSAWADAKELYALFLFRAE
jgi:dimethylhistidine N-methyltransferase